MWCNASADLSWRFMNLNFFSLSSPKYSEPMVNFSFLTKAVFKSWIFRNSFWLVVLLVLSQLCEGLSTTYLFLILFMQFIHTLWYELENFQRNEDLSQILHYSNHQSRFPIQNPQSSIQIPILNPIPHELERRLSEDSELQR